MLSTPVRTVLPDVGLIFITWLTRRLDLIIPDPRQIPQSEFPFSVSYGSSVDPVDETIEWWDRSKVGHSMWAIHQGKFIWESVTSWYGEGPMETYMKKGGLLKFWQLTEVTPEFKIALGNYCQNRINAPWWEHTYNWIGIVGQIVGIHWISTPGLEYCSQDVVHGYKKCASPNLAQEEVDCINKMDDNFNPAALFEALPISPSGSYSLPGSSVRI